ncbi:MAG: NAD(P)H-dependent oxidoreductase [Gammaproteobacteria bacterium]|nr:NAD(P)H-dependent oxidoreductase [Gammaproteobacteria bacterium]NND39434.1 flavodoxin family protein [Pseudomonadales bacterium]MBT8150421.1 NAD(P)H-dependent oxidoreductase [Gammaproteobacteria bacterium]NNL11907.1 flavodoxin family protein [Pseudomonadales bacterium]NNM11777.1 flavodoxin family protein [Pseudomonadales bacterium]
MKNLLIVYHSQSGNTLKLANAVASGARLEQGVSVHLLPALEAGLDELLQADGVLFGTPENLGYMSGALKDFFDRTFYPAEPHQLSTPYALFISAGNDGTGAVREIDRILRGYPMRKVAEPLIVTGEVDADALAQGEALGQAMAAAVAMGAF